ncbi:nucleotidyltransferase [bacterium]|nr:nucleotidyltransferase [bacterium]
MSFDESFLSELLDALQEAGLQAIIIGNTAAILQGVPVMTRDIDLFVREHEQLEKKLKRFAELFQVSLTDPYPSTSNMISAVGRSIHIDFMKTLSSGKSFSSLKSRAHRIKIGRHKALVADLKDLIEAKEAAGRDKDKFSVIRMKETLKLRSEMNKK